MLFNENYETNTNFLILSSKPFFANFTVTILPSFHEAFDNFTCCLIGREARCI